MNRALAELVKARIEGLPFVDTIAGMVQVIVNQEPGKDNNVKVSRFPVACDVTHTDCDQNKLKDLVPDSSKKSVIYFEDPSGANYIRTEGNVQIYRSVLKLVGWLNPSKLGHGECSTTAEAIGSLTKAIHAKPRYINSPPFVKVKLQVIGQEPRKAAIFSEYTYDENTVQYLMHPFDYFALRVQVEYGLNEACVEDFEVNPEIPC